MRNKKRIKVRKKYKAKYPDISRMNLSTNFLIEKKKKEIKVDLCESFKRNNLINFEENKGLISSSTIQI